MKKIIVILAAALLIGLLFVPGKERVYRDGGSQVRAAVLYKKADWVFITPSGNQKVSRVYWFPVNWKSDSQLRDEAYQLLEDKFEATILEINDNSVLVQLTEAYAQYYGSDKISFGISELQKIDAKVGSKVEVTFGGEIMESYPAQIVATGWKLLD